MEMSNEYILTGKPEEKRLLGTHKCRWEDNNKIDLKIGCESTG
jgi:hypothetical protein